MASSTAIAWFALGIGGALAGYSLLRYEMSTYVVSDESKNSETAVVRLPKEAELPAPAEAQPAVGDLTALAFDAIRIEPKGYSVFAGRALPNARVTLLANGSPVATTTALGDGTWSIVSDHVFTSGEMQLALTATVDGSAAVIGQTVSMNIPASSRAVAAVQDPSARAAMSSASPDGQAVVGRGPAAAAHLGADAGVHRRQQFASAGSGSGMGDRSGQPSAPPSYAGGLPTSGGDARLAGLQQQASETAQALPPPIKFVYGEAIFTTEGQVAAAQLADYVRTRHLETVTLSGHADERGSDPYNMELSRQRLAAIARYLREGGFSGRLVLLPKGKTEPFSGIDRGSLARDALFQLDRRVELHTIR